MTEPKKDPQPSPATLTLTPSPKRQLKRKVELEAEDDGDMNDEEAPGTATTPAHSPDKKHKSPRKGQTPSPTKDRSQTTPAKATAWTPEKRLALLDAVVKESNMTLDKWDQVAKVVGKTDTQAKDQWRQVLLPKLRKAITDGHV